MKSEGLFDSSGIGDGHSLSHTITLLNTFQHAQCQSPAGLSRTSMTTEVLLPCRCVWDTCAAPRRNIPIALRPARNSATSTFPSLLVSSLSNKSWYDLSLSASQHRAPGSKNVRSARYMLAPASGRRPQASCKPTDPS